MGDLEAALTVVIILVCFCTLSPSSEHVFLTVDYGHSWYKEALKQKSALSPESFKIMPPVGALWV